MSMFHPKTNAFDKRMKELFDEIDDELEEEFGDRYPLHPNRPKRGATANKSADGLFNIGVQFTPGYGSEQGRGYVVDFRIATLAKVCSHERELFLDRVVELIKLNLPEFFPDRHLEIVRDGSVFKIIGDFSLGSL